MYVILSGSKCTAVPKSSNSYAECVSHSTCIFFSKYFICNIPKNFFFAIKIQTRLAFPPKSNQYYRFFLFSPWVSYSFWDVVLTLFVLLQFTAFTVTDYAQMLTYMYATEPGRATFHRSPPFRAHLAFYCCFFCMCIACLCFFCISSRVHFSFSKGF